MCFVHALNASRVFVNPNGGSSLEAWRFLARVPLDDPEIIVGTVDIDRERFNHRQVYVMILLPLRRAW